MLCSAQAKAVACEIDAVGVVDQAIKNGVGVSRIADNVVPFVHRELAGKDCRFSSVAFFEDFEEVMPCGGVERFETPVVKDEELHAAERPQEPGIAAVAACERDIPGTIVRFFDTGHFALETHAGEIAESIRDFLK